MKLKNVNWKYVILGILIILLVNGTVGIIQSPGETFGEKTKNYFDNFGKGISNFFKKVGDTITTIIVKGRDAILNQQTTFNAKRYEMSTQILNIPGINPVISDMSFEYIKDEVQCSIPVEAKQGWNGVGEWFQGIIRGLAPIILFADDEWVTLEYETTQGKSTIKKKTIESGIVISNATLCVPIREAVGDYLTMNVTMYKPNGVKLECTEMFIEPESAMGELIGPC